MRAQSSLSIFEFDELKNRFISLSELQPTGNNIFNALSKKFNAPPAAGLVPATLVSPQIDQLSEEESPLALAYYCHKIWRTGQQITIIGSDVWEMPGHYKSIHTELIVG
ncbi:uncharacterized protein N7529_000810 [Penicillium soppii]|uniref:uncharacterized protein n=1 Tax=Penicillium soppii TaxID=69789 RepID=UPI00254895CA|nr:uncharacterized protein N7529_000810 [Penicillium soppii]KAJ5882138.1 hypothetical protein N7529_000810 [Penicillium soppii]